MAKVGRNDPCLCGSKHKAKRCCFSQERLSAAGAARRALLALQEGCVDDLVGIDRAEFEELYHEVIHLPELDISLQVRLPVLSPLVERARQALEEEGDDEDPFLDAVEELAEELDTPARRLELARAVVALRDAGCVEPGVAAVAMFDLNVESCPALLTNSVAESIAVSAGHSRTPGGLVIAAA
jgi:hypothetical protein